MDGNQKTYTLKEASQELNVSYRTVRYYKDFYKEEVSGEGRSLRVTQRFIDLVAKNRKANTVKVTDSKTKAQYKAELEELKAKYSKALREQKEIYDTKYSQFKDLDYDEETERIEVFTNEDYERFEQALQEWKLQKVKLEEQEKTFKVQMASKEELLQHYQEQANYQKKQADRILDQMDKLIDAIKRRDTIEAVEKKVIGKKADL